MRGKHLAFRKHHARGGITPAHAGKTDYFCGITVDFWDHPRACGENTSEVMMLSLSTGSPPRMRGKLSRAPQSPRP